MAPEAYALLAKQAKRAGVAHVGEWIERLAQDREKNRLPVDAGSGRKDLTARALRPRSSDARQDKGHGLVLANRGNK